MGTRQSDEENEMSRIRKQIIHEGHYAAELEIKIDDDGSPWGPTVDKDDVLRTDRVRLALRRGDVASAAREAKVFELLPLAGE
jgi:hypothetical protein